MKQNQFIVSAVFAVAAAAGAQTQSHAKHVLLLSIDGLHAVDYLNCAQD